MADLHFSIHLKLTQHCKLTMLQFKKKKVFLKYVDGDIYTMLTLIKTGRSNHINFR